MAWNDSQWWGGWWFAGDWFTPDASDNDMSASLAGTGTLTATLTSSTSVVGGDGFLLRYLLKMKRKTTLKSHPLKPKRTTNTPPLQVLLEALGD